jgi:hypothetical protein
MKNYLLKSSTAIALLGIGGITGAGLTARAGWADTEKVHVVADFPEASIAPIWTKVDAAGCPLAVAEMQKKSPEFSLSDCSVEEGTVLSITKGPTGGQDHVEIDFAFAVTTSKGSPE